MEEVLQKQLQVNEMNFSTLAKVTQAIYQNKQDGLYYFPLLRTVIPQKAFFADTWLVHLSHPLTKQGN